MTELMATARCGIVFTLNPDHLYHLQRNAAFFAAYRKADFITSDSKYVYWSLGWIGRRIQEKVSGSDIVPTFCQHHREQSRRQGLPARRGAGSRAEGPASASTHAKAARSSSARTGRR